MQGRIESETLQPSVTRLMRGATEYAQPADFCHVFREEMTSLFSLALLLAADRDQAETCFVGALDDCVGNPTVFAEAASSWARRAVMKRAVAALSLRGERPDAPGRGIPELHKPLDRVAQLSAFDRFVYAMTVLEGYRIRDCATLMNCSSHDVKIARERALQQVGRAARSSSSRSAFATMPAVGSTAFEPAS
jgi:hypothetical protein